MELPTLARILEFIDTRQGSVPAELRVLWLTVTDRRQELRDQLWSLRGKRQLYPVVLRDALFVNPNAVLRDVLTLLEYEKERIIADAGGGAGVCLLVLSMQEFGIPQQSSMVPAPDWLPGIGGRLINVPVEDVMWAAHVSLDDEEACIHDLKGALFELELTLTDRLTERYVVASNACNKLWHYLRLPKDTAHSMKELLASAHTANHTVSKGTAFRPYLADGLVGRLAQAVGTISLWQLDDIAISLADALGFDNRAEAFREASIVAALLTRPSKQPPGRVRLAREILLLCYVLFRWVGISGHAGEFNQLPVGVVGMTSRHLRQILYDRVRAIRGGFV